MKKTRPSTQPTQYTAFRCPIDLLLIAKALAKRDRRSLSNLIITLIDQEVGKISPAERTKLISAMEALKKQKA